MGRLWRQTVRTPSQLVSSDMVWTWTKPVFRGMERREQSVVTFIEISTLAVTIWKKDDFCLGLVDFQIPLFRYVYKGHLI